MKKELTQKRLKEVLRYYPITGNFRWKIKHKNTRCIMGIAGTIQKNGYRYIVVDGKAHRAHRLSFLYMTGKFPTDDVDHEDHNRSNNSWRNLRKATNQENSKNKLKYKSNKSGITGVCWHKCLYKWVAYINKNGKNVYLGYFDKKEDAIKVRKKAEKKHSYHPNHGKIKRVVLCDIR